MIKSSHSTGTKLQLYGRIDTMMDFTLCLNSVFTDGEVNILLVLLHRLQLLLVLHNTKLKTLDDESVSNRKCGTYRCQPAANSPSFLGSEVQWEEPLFLVVLVEILPCLLVHNG